MQFSPFQAQPSSREYYMMEEGARASRTFRIFSFLQCMGDDQFSPNFARCLTVPPLRFEEEKSGRSYHLSFLFFLVKIGVCSVGHFCARRSSTSFPGEGLCGGYSRATFRARKVAFISKKRFLVLTKKKKKTEID